MARIQLTAVVSDIRGKLAGNVFSSNKGGPYLRNRSIPANPKTGYQSLVRTNLSNLAKEYANTLTQAQRNAWTAYGALLGQTNVFGNNIILSGIAAFEKVNMIILQCGAALITTPPNSRNTTGILSSSLVANHTGPLLTLTFTPQPLTGTVGLYLRSTPALPPGISNAGPHFRFLAFNTPVAGTYEAHVPWAARFGTFPSTASGQRIFMSVRTVDTTLGAVSPEYIISTTVI